MSDNYKSSSKKIQKLYDEFVRELESLTDVDYFVEVQYKPKGERSTYGTLEESSDWHSSWC